MPPSPPRTYSQPAPPKRGATAALIGGAAAALLLGTLTSFEGKRNVGYRDIVGIPTKCMGDTKGVVVGRYYTDAECAKSLDDQAATHVAAVLQCTPTLRGHDNQVVAAGSLAYNIGTGAYCHSTTARLFNRGDWRGGCKAMLGWVKAGGRVIKGLQNRRALEYTICMKGL